MGEAFYIVYGNFKDIGNIIFSAYISIVLHFILLILWFSYKKRKQINNVNQQNNNNIKLEADIVTII